MDRRRILKWVLEKEGVTMWTVHLAPDMDQWRALVSMIMKLCVQKKKSIRII
jgi:hypothetical protein